MRKKTFFALTALQLSCALSAAAQTAPPPNHEAPLDELEPVRGKWHPVLYGFAEFDGIRDSTQSFNESAGNAAIARDGSYAAERSRMMFGIRNSRLGFKLTAPKMGDVTASAVVEMDFLGNQPATPPSGISEGAYFGSPTFRVRHLAMKVASPYVDVLIGQYWQLFGWQSAYHPNTVEIQGVPGQVYSRAAQVRVSHLFQLPGFGIEAAVAAARPPQRDSGTPDGQGGVRFLLNGWKGLHTMGATGTAIDSLSLGVSAVVRRFRVPAFSAPPDHDEQATGWGLSVDALLPIMPATNDARGNALTLTGSFAHGTGIADLYTGLTGGVGYPSLPNPGSASPAPSYSPDIDAGLLTYSAAGNLHTIDWQSFIVGAQYYLPPSGKVWLSANYSHLSSANADKHADAASLPKIFTRADWFDANVFWDVVSAVRVGAEYAHFAQHYADGASSQNHRVQASAFYVF